MSKPLPSGIVSRATAYNVDPTRVTARADWNNRYDMGDIEALAIGIKSTTAITPGRPYQTDMGVKRLLPSDPRSANFDFEVVYGHRRLLATQLLIKEHFEFPEGVNVYLIDRGQDDLTSLIQMFNENNQKPLLPLEEAAAFKRMRDAGMTIAQICKSVGRADVHVMDTLSLLEADEDLQAAVASGQVGGTMAKVIATTAKGDKALQKDLTAEAKSAKGKGPEAKAAKARLLKKLQDKKEAKAKAKGKTIKMRALTDDQLSELGAKVAKLLEVKAKEAGWKDTPELEARIELCKKDEALAAAYTLGALMALRAAAGLKIDLDI